MGDNTDAVRYSRAGDDFHIIWTAKRVLKLLDLQSNLCAVSIEGISSKDSSGDVIGLLAIDTAEYYGSEIIEDAEKIKYFQLKYSTVSPLEPWTASKLSPRQKGKPKGTIFSFAKNFQEQLLKYGKNIVESKFEYCFVTNRPVHKNVKKLLVLVRQGKTFEELPDNIKKVYLRFLEDSELEKESYELFLRTLNFLDLEASRFEQSTNLEVNANKFFPQFDADIRIKLKSLIHSRTMPEHRQNPSIRKETLLHIFGITKLEDLLPAPAQFEKLETYVPREQEQNIIEEIFNATSSIIIHASGGIGKSIFAQNISSHLPKNSAIVVFDGFANGSYRSPKDQRHLHKNGLIQIINEFAFKGFCLPILPTQADSDSLLKAFYSRLKDIVIEIKNISSDAFVVIVLDAADNSEMASQERDQRASFVKDILQDIPPEGCKIVALARTERLDMLGLPSHVKTIELKSFSEQETLAHLKTKFSEVDHGQLVEFYKLTFGNPRVQSYLLSSNDSLLNILKKLGKKGLSSDELIENQLKESLARIKEQSYSNKGIELLCQALIILPPMVPLKILETATGISQGFIKSFVSDMGLALLIKDESVQFRDEPVESWFRKTFQPSKELYQRLSDGIKSLSKSNPYVATTLPRILYGARDYESLYKNAYNSAELDIDDPVQRVNIIIENISYAVKLAKKQKDFKHLAKLLLEAVKIISSKDRHYEFIFDHSDLISSLVGPEFINDFLYRNSSSDIEGILYAHSALMLSMYSQYKAEARSFLRLTNEYLIEWSNLSEEKRNQKRIEYKDITNVVLAYWYLFDEKVAISELNRWHSMSTKSKVIKMVVKHLVEHDDKNITKLLEGLVKYPYLFCDAVVMLNELSTRVAKKDIESSLKFLLTQKKNEKLHLNVISITEQIGIYALDKKLVIKLLKKHLPIPSVHTKYDSEVDDRQIALRFWSLLYVLEDKELSVHDIISNETRREKKEDFERVYKNLIPLYILRAKLLSGMSLEKKIVISELSKYLNIYSANSWDYSRGYNFRDILFLAAYVGMDIIIFIRESNAYKIITDWLQSLEHYFINDYVWITLIIKIRFQNPKAVHELSKLAYDSISSNKNTSHLSYDYAKLARAILPINKEEAKTYFDIALEANSTLGEDARYRLDTLCKITNNINSQSNNPKLAYEFLKLSEMIYHYDDHKFPWHTVIYSIANIDKTSSLAAVSRLNYRDTASYTSSLSPLLNRFLKENEITAGTYASLFTLTKNDDWSLSEGIDYIINNANDEEDIQDAINLLINDFCMEYNTRDIYYAKKIKKVLDKHGIKNDLINNCLFLDKDKTIYHDSSQKDTQKFDWNEVFLDCECIVFEEIQKAFKRFKKLTHQKYINQEVFYQELRQRVPLEKRKEHLKNIYKILDAQELEYYYQEWTNIAIQHFFPKLIHEILTQNKDQFKKSYMVRSEFDTFIKLSGKTKDKVFELLIENSLNNILEYDVSNLLEIAAISSSLISSEDNIDVLKFGINQFKDDIEEDSSDGLWSDDLKPPHKMLDTLGAFIYTYLGLTRPEDRWRAMHTIRRLCKFGETKLLESIIGQLKEQTFRSFIDTRYTFYDLHAKLYLFIALARGAKENPKALLSFADVFSYYALDWLPHVLIRKYCVEISLELENYSPNTYTSEIFEKLIHINQSPYELKEVSDTWDRVSIFDDKISSISLGIDWEPYWFDSLARAFGIPEKDITCLIEDWIINKWGYDKTFTDWEKDLRAKHKIYREGDTYASHGSYPKEDDLDFYLIYHAMFCVSGDLLQKYPIGIDSYQDNLWDEWLSRHALLRDDGKWVSDRKDVFPIDLYQYHDDEYKNDNWIYSVQPDDFYRCLRFKENEFQFFPVKGNWSINGENVEIFSVLVNSKTSMALLRAYQTTKFPQFVYLPTYGNENHSYSSIDKYFKFNGWIVSDSSLELGFDEFDPLSKIPYPPSEPAPTIVRLHKLKPDEEKRVWKDSLGNTVFISEIWGDHIESDDYGERLQVDYSFLLKFLKNLNKDLLINVKIKRERKYDRNNYGYMPPYFKLFIFKKDGTVHELYKSYSVR